MAVDTFLVFTGVYPDKKPQRPTTSSSRSCSQRTTWLMPTTPRCSSGARTARFRLLTTSPDAPNGVVEVTLMADGDHTIPIIEDRGLPLEPSPPTEQQTRSTSKTSPPTWPAVNAATRAHGGQNSARPTKNWPPLSPSNTRPCWSEDTPGSRPQRL